MKYYMSVGKQWGLRIGIFFLILFMLMTSGITVLLASMNGYTLTLEEFRLYLFQQITRSKCELVMGEWENGAGYGISPYSLSLDYRGKTHFKFMVEDPDGKILYSTFMDENGVYSPVEVATEHTLPVHEIRYTTEDGHTWTDPFIYYEGENDSTVTHLYTIRGYYGYDAETKDLYDLADCMINLFHPVRYALPPVLFICLIILVILWYRMTVHTAHRQYLPDHPRYTGEVVLSFFDRIPGDLYLAVLICLFCFSIMLIGPIGYLFEQDLVYLAVWAFAVLISLALVFIMAAYITIAARIKAKTLFRNTLVRRCIALCWRAWLWCWRWIKRPFVLLGGMVSCIPLLWKTAVLVPVLLLCYGMFSSLMWENAGVFILWLLVTLVLYLAILYGVYCFQLLMRSGKALAEGNLKFKTDTKSLLYLFREHGENLNRIGDGMEKALAEKIRSERLKTELITNVSHDIKTPLTSIISYTDLLSREELDGRTKEYTEVLSRQAARLKKLIEDLIEASKASTGNIAVSPERLDICQIVRQSLGEYEERLVSHSLQIVRTIPAEEIYAVADGRQLWRVLDNLYSNVCKYAMPGTRVYVSTAENHGCVTISIKNISRDVLATDADDLTERFVQGDASRSSEGSGLGLNIAKSLTELQGGTFRVHCDGDLFRVDISLPAVE